MVSSLNPSDLAPGSMFYFETTSGRLDLISTVFEPGVIWFVISRCIGVGTRSTSYLLLGSNGAVRWFIGRNLGWIQQI